MTENETPTATRPSNVRAATGKVVHRGITAQYRGPHPGSEHSMSNDLTDRMTVDWPEGEHGAASLRRFTVSRSDAEWERLRAITGRGRGAPEGDYTGLYRNGRLWMSDTPDEKRDHLPFLWAVQRREAARVLVNGLGLGMVARALVTLPCVRHVDVCDIDPDVVALVGPHLIEWGAAHDSTVNVVLGDAHQPAQLYPPGTRWDAVWHDIWPNICADNWESMKTLRRRYARRADLQMCWSERETKYHLDRYKREQRLYRMFR